MDNFINFKLFTVPNLIAIGAVMFFWWAVMFAFGNIGGE